MKKMNLEKSIAKTGLVLAAVMLFVTTAFSALGIKNAQAFITGQLDFGDRGSEVTELQTYLSTDMSIYPSGLVTGYFGPLTQAGVQRFQVAQGIVSNGTPATTGYGRVGPLTRASINSHMGLNTGVDEYAPVIMNLNVNTSKNDATISWNTNEAARGKVYYSTSPIRVSNLFDVSGIFSGEPVVSGTLASYDGVARTSELKTINGLSSDTTYFYIVVSMDSSNNVSLTLPGSFRTRQ